MNLCLVAQSWTLLYRRIAFCTRHNPSTGSLSQCMCHGAKTLSMNFVEAFVESSSSSFSFSSSIGFSYFDVGCPPGKAWTLDVESAKSRPVGIRCSPFVSSRAAHGPNPIPSPPCVLRLLCVRLFRIRVYPSSSVVNSSSFTFHVSRSSALSAHCGYPSFVLTREIRVSSFTSVNPSP